MDSVNVDEKINFLKTFRALEKVDEDWIAFALKLPLLNIDFTSWKVCFAEFCVTPNAFIWHGKMNRGKGTTLRIVRSLYVTRREHVLLTILTSGYVMAVFFLL